MKKQHKLIKPIALTVLAWLSTAAGAETGNASGKPYYISPFGSYFHPGGDTHSADGGGMGLALGKVINEHFNVEARGFWQNYEHALTCSCGDTNVYGATLDGQYYFTRNQFSPYLVAGIGGVINDIHTSIANASQGSFIFEAGAGSTYKINELLQVRGDVRYRLNTLPDEVANAGVLNDLVLNLGFVVNLN